MHPPRLVVGFLTIGLTERAGPGGPWCPRDDEATIIL